MTSWQVLSMGRHFVAYEYDENGYTGRYAYVNGYADYPKPENIRGEAKR